MNLRLQSSVNIFTFTATPCLRLRLCTSFVDSAGAEDPLRELWTRGKGPLSDLSRRAALLLVVLAVGAIGHLTGVQCGAAA